MTAKANDGCLKLCSTADCLGSYASKGASVAQQDCGGPENSRLFFFVPTPAGIALPPPAPPPPRPPLAPPPPQQGQDWTAVINNSPFQLVNVRSGRVLATIMCMRMLLALHGLSGTGMAFRWAITPI